MRPAPHANGLTRQRRGFSVLQLNAAVSLRQDAKGAPQTFLPITIAAWRISHNRVMRRKNAPNTLRRQAGSTTRPHDVHNCPTLVTLLLF
jgi:hypothetical protein